MQPESIILLAAAAASIALLLLLRAGRSRLYNRSAGIGLVLITFPTSLAAFADVEWWVAIVLAIVGVWLWLTDPFGKA
jgi:uncharacterized membrane protein